MESTVRQTSTQPGTAPLWFRAKTQARPSQDYHLALPPSSMGRNAAAADRKTAAHGHQIDLIFFFFSSPFQRRQRQRAPPHPVPASHTHTDTMARQRPPLPASTQGRYCLLMLIPDPVSLSLPSTYTSRSGRCTTQTAEYTPYLPSQPATDARAKNSRSNPPHAMRCTLPTWPCTRRKRHGIVV